MKINISQDFSLTPGSRHYNDGEYSGQDFRENYLIPKFKEAIKSGEKLTIILDGVEGYASAFLDEAFGKLAREFGVEKVKPCLQFISEEDPFLINEIYLYMDNNPTQDEKNSDIIEKITNDFPIYRVGFGFHPTGGFFFRVDLGKRGYRWCKNK